MVTGSFDWITFFIFINRCHWIECVFTTLSNGNQCCRCSKWTHRSIRWAMTGFHMLFSCFCPYWTATYVVCCLINKRIKSRLFLQNVGNPKLRINYVLQQKARFDSTVIRRQSDVGNGCMMVRQRRIDVGFGRTSTSSRHRDPTSERCFKNNHVITVIRCRDPTVNWRLSDVGMLTGSGCGREWLCLEDVFAWWRTHPQDAKNVLEG